MKIAYRDDNQNLLLGIKHIQHSQFVCKLGSSTTIKRIDNLDHKLRL